MDRKVGWINKDKNSICLAIFNRHWLNVTKYTGSKVHRSPFKVKENSEPIMVKK